MCVPSKVTLEEPKLILHCWTILQSGLITGGRDAKEDGAIWLKAPVNNPVIPAVSVDGAM